MKDTCICLVHALKYFDDSKMFWYFNLDLCFSLPLLSSFDTWCSEPLLLPLKEFLNAKNFIIVVEPVGEPT